MLFLHLLYPLEEYKKSIQRESCMLVLNQKPYSGRISGMSYIVSWGLLDANVNQVMPCFNTMWKSNGSLLTMHLILNLSLNCFVTDYGKLILFPFKVTLTSFQSNSVMSQIMFLFYFTFPGVNIPINLNKWMLPAILHNIISACYWLSDMNSIIFTALENRCPVSSPNFLDFRMTKVTNPKIDKLSIWIVYYCIIQVHSISCTIVTLSCSATTPTSFICCRAKLVTRVLSFMYSCIVLYIWPLL